MSRETAVLLAIIGVPLIVGLLTGLWPYALLFVGSFIGSTAVALRRGRRP